MLVFLLPFRFDWILFSLCLTQSLLADKGQVSKVQRLVNLENQKQVRGVGVVFVAVGGCGGVGLVDDERMNASLLF